MSQTPQTPRTPAMSQTPQTPVVATRREAPVDEVATAKTVVSEVTDEQEEGYILDDPAKRKVLERDLATFVNKHVFPVRKFPMGREAEMKYCRIAAFEGEVVLPAGVSKRTFGIKLHKTVRRRLNELRANAQASMYNKFESKLAGGLVFRLGASCDV